MLISVCDFDIGPKVESNVLGKSKGERKSNLAQSRNVNRKYIIKQGKGREGVGSWGGLVKAQMYLFFGMRFGRILTRTITLLL